MEFLENEKAKAMLHDMTAHGRASHAVLLCGSRGTGKKLFARYLGQSPRQYLLQRRLDIARILLRNPNIPIGKVAENCGFSSIYHFSRAFHTAEGCSPSDYRAAHPAQLY